LQSAKLFQVRDAGWRVRWHLSLDASLATLQWTHGCRLQVSLASSEVWTLLRRGAGRNPEIWCDDFENTA
jgi:hypothetical protein